MKKLFIKVGKNHTLRQIKKDLIALSYSNSGKSDIESGQFFQIGGLLKIFPVDSQIDYSIDFFGDEIEKIYRPDRTKISSLQIDPNYLILGDGSIAHPESFIVHEDHGVGIFVSIGIKKMAQLDEKYIKIAYLNNDYLYIPYSQMNKLSSYIGVGRKKPKINKLGSVVWKKTYKKVYDDVIRVARELLDIYARREILTKKPIMFNKEWADRIEKSFQFRETIDQTKTIQDVYNDLAGDRPMDRLICGDVGFGKTEVAIRATAQVVVSGHQVVMMVPTTILAEQHYVTFKKRFADLPVRIGRISRFLESKKADEIIENTKEGKIDILIGTHKIIRSNIVFKDLGLLIIDEEQKFGVKDKEKLKAIKANIDVLTLTATPIPRTLFMSLSGIRDISQISSIPEGRKAIETKVILSNQEEIHTYIEREIERSGQIYYLHNEVSTISGKANSLRRQFPKLNIEVAHGQMGEKQLSGTMRRFANGEIDLLVCSTIVENGLDLPNVNTLIVEESDRFGLSQLYQIRGRIGRSKKQSYALFTYKDKKLTDNAVKRLRAIVENNKLGTGYNIAFSDLEIRGGGNILGREQHGNMEAIGLVLYSKMLKLAVEKIKNKG